MSGRYEPPTVRVEPSYLSVHIGDMVELRCIATGYPEPRLEWSGPRGSLPGDADVHDGLLRFRVSYGEQQGEYQCTATSSAGDATAVSTVVIEGKNQRFNRKTKYYYYM